MINDLTGAKLFTKKDKKGVRFKPLLDIGPVLESVGLVITGDRQRRKLVREVYDDGLTYCECCGCRTTPIDNRLTDGLCLSCASKMEFDKPVWNFKPLNRTQFILDLWNRCI